MELTTLRRDVVQIFAEARLQVECAGDLRGEGWRIQRVVHDESGRVRHGTYMAMLSSVTYEVPIVR